MHDLFGDAGGAPVIVYSALRDAGHQHRHARWDGERWRTRLLVATGWTDAHLHSGGASFDHADRARVVLNRVVGGQWEVELRRTADGGAG